MFNILAPQFLSNNVWYTSKKVPCQDDERKRRANRNWQSPAASIPPPVRPSKAMHCKKKKEKKTKTNKQKKNQKKNKKTNITKTAK